MTACGGGGGDGGGGNPPAQGNTCAGGAAYQIVSTASPVAGKNAGAAVLGCTGAIGRPVWTQTSGPAVTLLADKTQTIGFEPPAAGSYAFNLAFTDPTGAARNESVALNVGANGAPKLTLRVSQSVRMGGNVSVRAWPAAGETVQSITWSQLSGPAVALNTNDPYVALFVAPTVSQDTVIRLRATLTTSTGAVDSDEALVVVERAVPAPSGGLWEGQHVSRVYPYKSASPYAGALASCTYDAALTSANLCSLATLPFLAQANAGQPPTVEQVMDRVLVSHDWLGRNFENFLRTQDANGDFRRMLMSTTAIVLGSQVRPSFYYAGTGAIYLDGDNFWLTPGERDTVNEAPDFRSDFDKDLQYTGLWRYVQNNRSIFVFFDPRSRVNRDLGYLVNESGWLLYHELSHALDFLPPSAYGILSNGLSAWGNISPRVSARQLTSDTVPASFPLNSSIMRGLGQVKFQGVAATATQRAYTPTQVGGFFSADVATDEYSYSTPREDIAMTQEEVLMSRRLGIQRDMAITDKYDGSTSPVVRWGQRGRVGESGIKPRARAIVAALVPWLPTTEVDALPTPLPMRVGDTWAGNLTLPAPPGGQARALSAADAPLLSREQQWLLRKEMQRMAHHRHQNTPRLPVGASEAVVP